MRLRTIHFKYLACCISETLSRILTVSFHFRVSHSNTAIVKPPQANASVNSREMEEAMRKVKEAHSLIAAAVEPGELHARVARSR